MAGCGAGYPTETRNSNQDPAPAGPGPQGSAHSLTEEPMFHCGETRLLLGSGEYTASTHDVAVWYEFIYDQGARHPDPTFSSDHHFVSHLRRPTSWTRYCRRFQQVAERASHHGERGVIRWVAGQGLEVIKGCPSGHRRKPETAGGRVVC